MKIRWTRTTFLFFLMVIISSCATTPKGEKLSQETIEKKESSQKSEEKKIEKSDEGSLERRDERAIRKMARVIARERAEDFYRTGIIEYNKGDFQDAMEAFLKAVEENREDYQSYFGLGQSYEKLNKAQEAAAAYEETVRLNPIFLPAREALGLLYFHQKKFQEAEKHLKEARTLRSKVAEIYYCLGEIEQRERACQTAIIAYKQALILNPDYVAARNGLKAAEAACRKKKAPPPPKTPPSRK